MNVNIRLPSGQNLICDRMFADVLVLVNEVVFPADLLVLELPNIDVILGIDWFSTYRACWDFHADKLSLRTTSGVMTSYLKSNRSSR